MRKISVKLMAALAAAGMCMATSCSSQKSASTEIAGEWNIIIVGDTVVSVPEGEEQPFLGFDKASGRLFGNAGCNSLIGSYTADPAKGSLTFSNVGATRMMCPDMSLEQIILATLPEVEAYHATTSGDIELTNAAGQPLITLSPRK